MQPVMITAAMVGAEVTKAQQSYLPTAPQEIIQAAIECSEAKEYLLEKRHPQCVKGAIMAFSQENLLHLSSCLHHRDLSRFTIQRIIQEDSVNDDSCNS